MQEVIKMDIIVSSLINTHADGSLIYSVKEKKDTCDCDKEAPGPLEECVGTTHVGCEEWGILS